MPLPLIIGGAALTISVAGNIYQGIQNKKLKKRINELYEIMVVLKEEIEEKEKEIKALKLFAFRTRAQYKRQLKELKSDFGLVEIEYDELTANLN